MRKLALVLGLMSTLAMGAELYNSGGFITHAGQGFGGADVSMASLAYNSGGHNMLGTYREADDFIVGAGGWTIDSIKTHGYATNAPAGNPGWTGFSMKIWAGASPGLGSPVYQTTAAPTITFTNVYRVFNGAANLLNTARAVNSLTWSVPNINLPAGQYWVDVNVTGGSTGWWNYVMQPNPTNPNDPITVPGNAYTSSNSGGTWASTIYGTPPINLAFPLAVYGVPEPAALALLALGLLIRRR